MFPQRLLIAGMSIAAVCCASCASRQARTVPGPETDKLVPQATGYVLMTKPPSGITAIELPSLKETIVRREDAGNPNDTPTIHMLSGPDRDGRIAYIEDHYFVANDKNKRHALKMIRIDGK